MKRIYLIMAVIVAAMMMSCNPKDEDDNNNLNGNNGGGGSGDNKINGYEYVDLGLPSGLKWATCNVGADKPEDYGDYFAWGETGTKKEYTIENSLTYGQQMNDISGNAQYDAATFNWGGSWRTPTKDEMQELLDHCEWEFTQVNGVLGSKFIGHNGNSIFLPAAGLCDVSSFDGVGNSGFYWSSTPVELYDMQAYGLVFYSVKDVVGTYGRPSGLSVRPVSE